MAVQTLHDTNVEITSKMDGGVYACVVSDGVIDGIGDNFAIQHQSDSLSITFHAGSMAVLCGAFFKVTSDTTVTLAANSTIYLCASINMASNDPSNRGSFQQRTSSTIHDDNLNDDGEIRDLLLYRIKTNNNGVTEVSDRRTFSGINASSLRIVVDGTTYEYSPTSGSDTTLSIPSPKAYINTARLLRTYSKVTSEINYTATEDCAVIFTSASSYGGVYVDGVQLWGADGSYMIGRFLLIAKGSVLRLTGTGEKTLRIFGLK